MAISSSSLRASVDTPKSPRGHLPMLDGLRGLAVFMVMLHHFFQFGGMQVSGRIEKAANLVASAGWCGVDLFFVLSGFLITGILWDTRERPGFFKTFYSRRVLRIFPLYYAFLALCFFVFPALDWTGKLNSIPASEQLWQWSYLSNVQCAIFGWEGVPVYLRHFWSLAIEEQFYMVWPWVVFSLSRCSVLRLCVGVIVGALLLRVGLYSRDLWVASYVLTPSRMDGLAMGAALALIVREPRDYAVVLRWARPTLTTVLILVGGGFLVNKGLWRENALVGTLGYTLIATGFGALLVVALTADENSGLLRVLVSRPLRFLGKYSYALYVFHMPIALLLPQVGISASRLPGANTSPILAELLFILVAMGASTVAALLSWNLMEKHFLKLKDHFNYSPARAPSLASESSKSGTLD